METIAFYSYKGGVGRSLLVANAARFLGMLGKSVVALDLDFEAPGLHYKLGRIPDSDAKSAMTGGVVPYLVATAKGAKNPPPLQEHMIELALPKGTEGWLRLMPAGPAPRREYWIALKQLRERLQFDDPSGKGLAVLLDLHARIIDELKPDYLLIDARTGVTELGGLATTALADCVVCLLVPNQESIDGTLAIAKSLKSSERLSSHNVARIVPVISRTTGDLSEEGKIAEGVNNLLEISDGRKSEDKKRLKPFILPHDSVLGATDKIVGGEKKASTFSPLYEAYLELFQHLFPQSRKNVEEVLERLKAISSIRKELTEQRRGRFGTDKAFDPWEDSSIEEGAVLKSDRNGTKSRYADLVCRNKSREVVMVVEYVLESKESEALECWKDYSYTRCVVLLSKSKYSYNRNIYSRSDTWAKFQDAERYEPPFPKEFEIFSNPGKRSVDEMMEALHRGYDEMVPEVIAQWKECMAAMAMPKRGPRWRPVEARRILDGLAATDKVDVASKILRYASKRNSYRSDYDDFGGKYGGSTLDNSAENDLFAPLLWRLPVEAAVKYLNEPDHPFAWTPCLAGHRLLAEKVMGLRYDPLRSALKDIDFLSAQIPNHNSDDDHDDERMLHMIHRQFYDSRSRFCDDPPPFLLWDQQFREDRYWRGDSESVSSKARENANKLVKETSRLRAWLRDKVKTNTLVTSNLLGRYDLPSGRLDLYPAIIDALAPLLGLQSRYLKSVVFIQLSVIAMGHQARDFDGQPGFGFAVATTASPFQKESPVHIALMQYFTCRLIEQLNDMNLKGAFEKLSDKQPEPYRRWRRMRHTSVEQMRTALLRARLGESAVGLPGPESEG